MSHVYISSHTAHDQRFQISVTNIVVVLCCSETVAYLDYCSFLLHVSTAMLMRDIDIGIVSVHPSVRPFVRHISVLYRNGLTCRHYFFTAQ